jgi:hypothetical protein
MKDIALQYVMDGLSAIPAIVAEKRPAIYSWKTYQKRLPTLEEWDKWIADGLCIICGEVSGNLLMIDFDQQAKAFESWKQSIPHDIYNRLVIEQSQSGGLHVIIRSENSVPKNQKLAVDKDKKILIETRGEGGLFLCAPTQGYKLIQGNFSNIWTFYESEIDTLLNAATALNQYNAPPEQPKTKSPPTNPTNPTSNVGERPGDNLNESGRDFIRSILLKHNWTYMGDEGHNELWLRSGKTKGRSATLHKTDPVFYVFSSNCEHFTSGKGYSFFETYTLLEHDGDHSEAAKELARLGYGNNFYNTEQVELPDWIVGENAKKKITKMNLTQFPYHN